MTVQTKIATPEPVSSTTQYAATKYMPERKEERKGFALCLSGGGFRATLFHMGGLRRLNELGLLSQIDSISSVSGGSVLAAYLADQIRPWPARATAIRDWDENVRKPFLAITSRNLRTWPLLKRLLPWNWRRDRRAVTTLAAQYEKFVTHLRLLELPDYPRFLINATDMGFGINWVFDSQVKGTVKGSTGDDEAGYHRPLPAWPLATAVAASSCFPPIFNPLPLGLKPTELVDGRYRKSNRDRIVQGIELSDGGVYDNLGLEPVWKDHAIVLVSDGGAVFEPDARRGLFWRLQRYVTVVDSQVRDLRKRWLISNFARGEILGAYWGVGSVVAHYDGAPGYSEGLVDDFISKIRTDLDAFSLAEAAVLENHGYMLADAAIQRHVSPLIQRGVLANLTIHERRAEPPNPDWMDEAQVQEALRYSHKIRALGRGKAI